ncbi:hypothetical protein FV232_04605 [Methylobacterium sp. WL30]|uniref:hypothetical protein n=1 Tax=unclassified Methylobacterium TaxID=2615210 RepID=UPI0011CABA93|nr:MULTISPECIES: hypothetical protein [unclassified Methylobacterium]TXN41536.1 hypothetical protein FV225_02010 [Methylobacterium sp. WL93]TXN52456.1 hypothetical protein FV227_03175 [Methylobacterium sp. WL119]TXN69741.1 hypothetical protein FV232_04605 [Methylobacterium sp. WL30]
MSSLDSTAVTASTAAIQLKGEDLITAGGGGHALEYVANRIHTAAQILDAAVGLTVWACAT